MLNNYLEKLIRYEDLTETEAHCLISMIMDGKLTNLEIAGILTALIMKGETSDEIIGFSKGMKERALKINTGDRTLIDVCGTGADNSNSFNISTLTAFVLAGAGLKVVKHGNRSISSKCGSADLIKAFGIRIALNEQEVIQSLNETNFAFIFAPAFHPSMKIVAPIRKELAIKTIFNIMGPLTNPAEPQYQMVGVYDQSKARTIAEFFLKQQKKAFVIHSTNGWDEATTICPFTILEISYNEITEETIDPRHFNFKNCRETDLQADTIEQNLDAAIEALSGTKGALRDALLLNGALAFLLTRKVNDMQEGIQLASETIDRGLALQVIEKLRNVFPSHN